MGKLNPLSIHFLPSLAAVTNETPKKPPAILRNQTVRETVPTATLDPQKESPGMSFERSKNGLSSLHHPRPSNNRTTMDAVFSATDRHPFQLSGKNRDRQPKTQKTSDLVVAHKKYGLIGEVTRTD